KEVSGSSEDALRDINSATLGLTDADDVCAAAPAPLAPEPLPSKRIREEKIKLRAEKVKPKVLNLDAFHFIAHAWREVRPQSIRNCFHHVPILSDAQRMMLSPNEKRDKDVLEAISEEHRNIFQHVRLRGSLSRRVKIFSSSGTLMSLPPLLKMTTTIWIILEKKN
ncbi:hypothetical protein BGX21_004374, partial [Mortierella sp. AD011]